MLEGGPRRSSASRRVVAPSRILGALSVMESGAVEA